MRYLILLASVGVQLCLGGIYAWSTFVPWLTAEYGLTAAQTQLIFGLLFGSFTGTMVFAGKYLERRGPRGLLFMSGLLFFAGYLVASVSGGSFGVIVLGIGGMAGAATGMGYVCPISTCVKWFPRHKGVVTGVAVAGFGAGAIVLASVGEAMLEAGVSVLTIFRWMGVAYGVIIFLAGLIMRFPEPAATEAIRPRRRAGGVWRDVLFWTLGSAMFCGTFAGLMIIGSLSPIAQAQGISPRMAAIGVSTFAVGNGIGRIVWGRVVDVIGRRVIVPSLLTLAAAVAVLIPATFNPWVFALAACAAGFGFGANFVVHAALTAERFGIHRVGEVYPLIFLAYGVAGITGPVLGGYLRDATGGYGWSITLALAVLGIGVMLSAALLRRAGAPVQADLAKAQ